MTAIVSIVLSVVSLVASVCNIFYCKTHFVKNDVMEIDAEVFSHITPKIRTPERPPIEVIKEAFTEVFDSAIRDTAETWKQ